MSDSVTGLTSELVSSAADYATLRERAPLVRVTLPEVPTPTWLVTRYEDVATALEDHRFVRDARALPGQDGPSISDQMIDVYGLPEEYRHYFGAMVLADGEEHARLRSVLTRAFTGARVKALRPRTEDIARELADALVVRGHADLVREFGSPLAGSVLCELVGIAEADRSVILDYIGFIHSGGDPSGFVPKLQGLVEHLKHLIARRRSEPADDLVSALVRLADEEGGLAETEIVAILFLLVSTGIMPPTQFIADAVLALLDHPAQMERLRAEPALLTTTAVPELLRFTSSVPLGAPVYATEDLELCGMPVKQGEAVTPGLLAANHDPGEYVEPGELDLGRRLRRGVGHMALGHGAHYCIGASMARLLGEVALEQLVLRHEGLALALPRDQLEWRGSAGDGLFLAALPVTW